MTDQRDTPSHAALRTISWTARLIGAVTGLVVGPLLGLLIGVILIFAEQSMWCLLICPLSGLIVGPAFGAVYPAPVIALFEHLQILSDGI